MSGQQSRNYDPTPTRYADVGTAADLPREQTAPYKATAAQYVNQGQGLEALGSALGSFFNAGAKALETVAEANHRQELVQVERENRALAEQGVADQKLGKPMDPQYADRHAYASTYQLSSADQHAFELSEGLRAHMAQQPLDGSVDLAKVAQDYFKQQVGPGTGNPEYDARLLSQFSRAAEQQVTQFNEAQRATVLQNSTEEVIQGFTQRVLSHDGITTPQFAEYRSRLGDLVHGDTAKRDKILMAAIAGSVQNDGQGQSVLRAMQDLGLDKTEPEYFNRISGEVLKRTNAVKTYDAGQAVQSWQQDLALEKRKYDKGILPPAVVAEFAKRWFAIDSIHGVGMGNPALEHEWARGTQKAAAVNLWDAAFDNILRTQDSTRVAAAYGKSPASVLSEHYDSAMSRRVVGISPNLAATVDGTGLVRPSSSDAATADYATFVLTPGHRAASQNTISDTYKAEMGNPLLGRDPVLMARSFGFYNALSNGGLTDAELHRYFPNEQAENMFHAMQSLANGGRGIKQIAQDLVDHPYDAKQIADATRSGHVDLAAVARRGGVTGKPEEIDAKITAARNAAILDSTDRKRWFGNKPVGMDSNESAVFDVLLLDQFQVQKRSRGLVNLDEAVNNVAKQTGKYIVVPGYDGALQAIRDPFNGAGRVMQHPLNEDPNHPLSVAKGYAPIYAPGQKMQNAMGQQEDLVVTWAEDAAAAHKMLPGKVNEGSSLFLERPSEAGLSKVKTATGETIQFLPGEKVALRTGDSSVFDSKAGLSEAEVPKDPQAAAEFFRKNLGPGWYVQQDGFHDPAKGQGYTLYYGGRLKVGEKERDQQIADRAKAQADHRAITTVNGVTDLPGGAAILYPKAIRNGTP